MTVEEKTLKKALTALGRTGEGVRKKLVKAGAKGVPEDPNSCSIAAYLLATFPGEDVAVDGSTIVVNGATVPTPKGASQFIDSFDEWEYPELVEHYYGCAGIDVVAEEGWDGGAEYIVSCSCERLFRTFGDEKREASTYARRARKAYA